MINVHREYHVICDVCGLNWELEDPIPGRLDRCHIESSVQKARQLAVKRGWIFRGGKDICPRHNPVYKELLSTKLYIDMGIEFTPVTWRDHGHSQQE